MNNNKEFSQKDRENDFIKKFDEILNLNIKEYSTMTVEEFIQFSFQELV